MSRRAFAMLLMAVVMGRGAAADTPLRVLFYNIHHGRDTDGVVNLERIAAVIRGWKGTKVVSHADRRVGVSLAGKINRRQRLGRGASGVSP
jgi:endonuclease/exonuclease/phosphatase family metal-dependent hydrolase